MSGAYYNEFNPEAAETLENLIKAGDIAPGQVDTRSIEDVRPDDLRGFTQCHFFAGFGIWSYALRRAGWSDDRPVWTGSCPCQPFSAAGKGAAFDDERHLWPAFDHLIKVGRPPVVFGEQVASAAVDDWIDLVHADLEAMGYSFGSVPFPSAGVGAPHIRDRNFWVAHATQGKRGSRRTGSSAADRAYAELAGRGDIGILGNASGQGLAQRERERGILGRAPGAVKGKAAIGASIHAGRLAHSGHDYDAGQSQAASAGKSQADRSADQPRGRGVSPGGLADADGGIVGNGELQRQQQHGLLAADGSPLWEGRGGPQAGAEQLADNDGTGQRVSGRGGLHSEWEPGPLSIFRSPDNRPGPTNGFWRDADWLGCRDGKWRPVEPGSFPLAYGLPAGMGKLSAGALRLAGLAGLDAASLKRAKSHRIIGLRGAGNAINAEAAIAWIETVMECIA